MKIDAINGFDEEFLWNLASHPGALHYTVRSDVIIIESTNLSDSWEAVLFDGAIHLVGIESGEFHRILKKAARVSRPTRDVEEIGLGVRSMKEYAQDILYLVNEDWTRLDFRIGQ